MVKPNGEVVRLRTRFTVEHLEDLGSISSGARPDQFTWRQGRGGSDIGDDSRACCEYIIVTNRFYQCTKCGSIDAFLVTAEDFLSVSVIPVINKMVHGPCTLVGAWGSNTHGSVAGNGN